MMYKLLAYRNVKHERFTSIKEDLFFNDVKEMRRHVASMIQVTPEEIQLVYKTIDNGKGKEVNADH